MLPIGPGQGAGERVIWHVVGAAALLFSSASPAKAIWGSASRRSGGESALLTPSCAATIDAALRDLPPRFIALGCGPI